MTAAAVGVAYTLKVVTQTERVAIICLGTGVPVA